jgi:hypothetical protein
VVPEEMRRRDEEKSVVTERRREERGLVGWEGRGWGLLRSVVAKKAPEA